jgi:hypothetical protein
MDELENFEDCNCEFNGYSSTIQEMAKQIVNSFVEKNFTIHNAKSVLRACEILLEFNSTITLKDF